MNNPIPFNQAISFFLEAKKAQRLSRNTLIDYERTLSRFEQFVESDPPIDSITTTDVRRFLNSLSHLSKKSLRNVYIG